VAGHEQELDRSLREFDEMLLSEQQDVVEERVEIAEARAARQGGAGGVGGGLGGAAAGSAGASDPWGFGDESDDQSESSDSSESGSTGTGGSPSARSGPDREGAEPPSGAGQADRGRVPEDVGNGNDDDIVARQLREAAMAEDDPELREKLWDEYRRYKNGESAPRSSPEDDSQGGQS
jgi:hypothetical protein